MKEFVFRSEEREPRSTRRGRTYLKSHERNDLESVMHKRTIRRSRALTLFEKKKTEKKHKPCRTKESDFSSNVKIIYQRGGIS